MVMSFTPLVPLLMLRVRHLALEAIMMRRAWGASDVRAGAVSKGSAGTRSKRETEGMSMS